MRICGIVAEYNPFHAGHSRHIAETRRALGGDAAIVCAMSGDSVQRGENAVLSRHARAEAAVRCGADLVLELPLPWALSSAEGFARGGVGLLSATGVVDSISFGSECGSLALLQKAVGALRSPAYPARLKEELAVGVSFAAARQRALEAVAGEPLTALRAPNDLLVVEYLKAVEVLRADLTPVVIPRVGAGHDSPEPDALPSASFLRRSLAAGEDISRYLPEAAAEVLARETARGRGPVLPSALEGALLSRLRALDREAFSRLPDAGEGLGNRLYEAVRASGSLEEVYALAKTKRYAHARVRRMCACAALGVDAADAGGIPPYLRVLASTGRGVELLHEMKRAAALPILTRGAAVRELDERAQRVFALDSGAADLLALGYTDPSSRRCDREYLEKPLILDKEQGGKRR